VALPATFDITRPLFCIIQHVSNWHKFSVITPAKEIGRRGRGEEDPAWSNGTESGAGGVKTHLATAMLTGQWCSQADLIGDNLFSGCFDKIEERKYQLRGRIDNLFNREVK